jgi:nucleoside-diphosphate-sugar epimerase
MSNIAVIGGSGFIGTRLVERLISRGAKVVIGDKVRSERFPRLWRACDVTVPGSLPEILRGADVVVNLAAEHRDDVRPLQRYHDVNVRGAEHVCAAATDAGIDRLVFTSSVAVYGLPNGVMTEEGPCAPFNEYGRTKLFAEEVYRSWLQANPQRALVIVRPTVVFGEGNRGNVYNLLRQIADGRFVMVGDGRNRKSLAYVGNVADFLVHTLASGSGMHLFNYADEPDLDMVTLTAEAARHLRRKLPPFSVPYAAGYSFGAALDVVARVTGKAFPLSAVRIKKFCSNSRISPRRALDSGFQPSVSIVEALARVIQSDFPPAGEPG